MPILTIQLSESSVDDDGLVPTKRELACMLRDYNDEQDLAPAPWFRAFTIVISLLVGSWVVVAFLVWAVIELAGLFRRIP